MAEPAEPDAGALRARLIECLGLKALPRAGWVRVGVPAPESVAAHSWGVAWLALALCPPGLDRGRALAIAILHDLAEVRVGDLTPHDPVAPAEKARRELAAFQAIVAPFAGALEFEALYREYADQASPEGRFVKACDKVDMALQALAYQATGGPADLREFVDSALAKLTDPDLRALCGG